MSGHALLLATHRAICHRAIYNILLFYPWQYRKYLSNIFDIAMMSNYDNKNAACAVVIAAAKLQLSMMRKAAELEEPTLKRIRNFCTAGL